jgi:pyruvate dehydrogenase E1 component beta subunit
MPASADEAYWSFRDALQRPTPTLFFEDRSIHNRSGEIAATNPGAKARVTRSGDRVTIIAAGRTATLAEDTADQLAKEGRRGAVEVVSLGFIKPLDRDTILKAASKTGRVLIVQDEPPWSGYAPYIRCLLDELPSSARAVTPRIIAGADEYLPYWDERPFLPSLKEIIDSAMDLMQ